MLGNLRAAPPAGTSCRCVDAGGVRAAGGAARPVRARAPARRRLPDRGTTPAFATVMSSWPGAGGGARRASSGAQVGAHDYVLRHVDGRRGGVRIANPVTEALRELTSPVPARRRSSFPGLPAELAPRSARRAPGSPRHGRRTGHSTRPHLPNPVHDDVRHACVTTSSSWSAHWAASPTAPVRRADDARPGAGAPRAPPPRRTRPRHPTARGHRSRSGSSASAKPTKPRAAVGRCASSTRIEPVGEMETMCIQVAAQDSLYVTDDFIVTHNTLNDAFVILDEAQNTTAEQMKMFLTRLGFGSKMVVTGDVTQVDLPGGAQSGLRIVRDILDGVDDVKFTNLTSATSSGTGWSATSSTPTTAGTPAGSPRPPARRHGRRDRAGRGAERRARRGRQRVRDRCGRGRAGRRLPLRARRDGRQPHGRAVGAVRRRRAT